MAYELISPSSVEQWQTYHAIRRKVLFENRGFFNRYQEDHPDEFRDGNHPFVLIHDSEIIGVIRVDIDGTVAIFRRVAIRDDLQRRGHGKQMLELAEAFARRSGCALIRSFVNPEAVTFYERCGFERDTSLRGDAEHKPMFKRLA